MHFCLIFMSPLNLICSREQKALVESHGSKQGLNILYILSRASGSLKSNFQINTSSNLSSAYPHIKKSSPLLHPVIKSAEIIQPDGILPEKVSWEPQLYGAHFVKALQMVGTQFYINCFEVVFQLA